MKIMHVNTAINCIETKVIGFAMRVSGLHPAASKPYRKAIGIMITACTIAFGIRGSAKLATKPNQSIFEQPSFFKIAQKSSNRLINRFGMISMLGKIRMLIPSWVVGIITVINLNITNISFCKPTSHQTKPAIVISRSIPDTIIIEGGLGFAGKIQNLWGEVLHSPTKLERIKSGFVIFIRLTFNRLLCIKRAKEIKVLSLILYFHGRMIEILDGSILSGDTRTTHRCPLKDRGQKSIAEIPRATITHRRAQGHKARKVFIFATQTITNPTTHRRADQINRTCMHEKSCRAMSNPFGSHSMQHAKIINMRCDIWKKIGDLATRFTILIKLPQ